VLYIFARENKQIRGAAKEKRLLEATTIHLRVLAPCAYYARCELSWLEKEINSGLEKFLADISVGTWQKTLHLLSPQIHRIKRDRFIFMAIVARGGRGGSRTGLQ
jgi:hypothetical protein